MTVALGRIGSLVVAGIVGLAASGCATAPAIPPAQAVTPHLDPNFIGVWRNSNDRFRNWWGITETRATNYGVDREAGTCLRGDAQILGPDSIRVTFGRTGEGRLALNVGLNGQEPRPEDRGHLVIFVGGSASVHHRVPRRDICLIDGVYLPNAPYPDGAAAQRTRNSRGWRTSEPRRHLTSAALGPR